MSFRIISTTLILITALFLVTYNQVSAQDDLSDGEILNVPDFDEQPVNAVENLNVNGLNTLTTLFASNNGRSSIDAGIFFDIENLTGSIITIQRWDINVTCGSIDISVYMRMGTFQGFVSTMDGWTLVGSETGIVCTGDDLPTPLNVGGIVIEPGETIGIAMVFDTGGAQWQYTNGTGNNQIYSNGHLEIRTGSVKDPALQAGGSFFTPRVWNGTVYYSIAPSPIPTLSEWGLIALVGVLGIIGLLAIQRRKLTA